MTEEQARIIVDRNLRPFMDRLALLHWTVRVRYAPIERDDEIAHVKPQIDYDVAVIIIDAAKVEDEEHLLRTLRHELLHLVTAPHLLLGEVIDEGATGDNTLQPAMRRLHRYTGEQLVSNLESMLDGHPSTAFETMVVPAPPE